MPLRTLLDIFDRLAARSRPDLLHYKEGGTYRTLSSDEMVGRVRRLAAFLAANGVEHGDRIALLSENRPEWIIADFAIQLSGAVNVPIYTTSSREQIRHLLRDSGCRMALISKAAHLDKIAAAAQETELGCVILFEAPPPRLAAAEGTRASDPRASTGAGRASLTSSGPSAAEVRSAPVGASGALGLDLEVLTLDEAYRRGEASLRADPTRLETRRSQIDPAHLASIIYTSGTTGEPKGVMLTHGNFCSNIDTCLQLIPFTEGDLALSFLPLSHVFERTVEYIYLAAGGSIAFAESIDTVAANLVEVRPTVVSAVPRVLEKIHARVLERAGTASPMRRRVFNWALAAGRRRLERRLERRGEPWAERIRMLLAERLVFRPIKESLGGRMRFVVSGGAPLRTEIAEFLLSTGITVLEGYGLTETSPVIAVNTLDHLRPGTVGRIIPGVEVKIEEDGEILVRGPNIMKGYFGRPEETHEVMREGWFATGDIGQVDRDGFLSITDRKKDLLITSGGKNVAPQPIEGAVKASRYIANVMLVGDRQPFIAALIVPDFAVLGSMGESSGWGLLSPADLIRKNEVLATIDGEIRSVNACLAPFEQIKKFALLERDFTAEAGELTPTLKVKRRVILEHFAPLVESLYRS